MTRTGVYVDDYLECESSFTLAFVIFYFVVIDGLSKR